MRHHVKGKKLNRDAAQRKALALNLSRELITHERIRTTRAKADFVRGKVERMITIARRGLAHEDPQRAVHARRIVASRLNNDRKLVGKVFDELAPRYEDRPGGYTRIYRLGPRKGDNAPMVMLELVDREED
ncbi:MAG: 50S ribosomal protein L17 [Anaerolineaceae bacterium]|nr:50S ribosomal protein L17 [Anaerolineaceae bacterium]MCY3907913.1 50S ribosomal protein L17 [Anaerolineaceae bacterium]MDD9954905.1 50S ribosomal protein L17 [Anaerolineaceae bacterium]MDE0328641.1 50S ribosomal protein L17 [Anaerolineaceae bacterium]MDE0610884.1 50S ribosomal protein L17 [Anaerolineaceae bacterium]